MEKHEFVKLRYFSYLPGVGVSSWDTLSSTIEEKVYKLKVKLSVCGSACCK